MEALNETYDDIRKDLEEKYVFVAFINGEPVGSVRIKINEDGTAYLSRFGVRSNNQNNGIGKTLMNVVDKVMQEHQVKQLRLHTAASYIPLVRFYYGRGFYIDSTEKDRDISARFSSRIMSPKWFSNITYNLAVCLPFLKRQEPY